MTNENLEGRIALITGGARGIGKAISENLAQKGCNIIIFDPGYSISGNHDDKNLAEKISEEINKNYNVKTLAITKDVSSIEDVKNSVDLILKRGQISLHDVYMVHGSEENKSTKSRRAMTMRFMPTTSIFDHRFVLNTRDFSITKIYQASIFGHK